MEDFPTDLMLFFSLILMLFLETWRMFLFRRFRLHLPRQAPWQETYYVRYAFLCFALAPFFTALVNVLNVVWRVARQDPYAAGLFLLVLAGCIAGLIFVALRRVMPLPKLMPLLLIGTVLDILFFIYKGTRLFFGGTLLLLVTSAIGHPMRFTDWAGMLEWLKGSQGGEEARVLFLVQAEAVLRRNAVYLFSLERKFARELDNGQVPASLREQLQQQGKALTVQALVKVEQDGRSWTIIDADKKYHVSRHDQSLDVYEPTDNGSWTSVHTTGATAPSTVPSQRIGAGVAQQLTFRLAGFVQRHWAEWIKLRKAGRSRDEINLNLYLGIQHEFFPGWAAMLDELAQIVALIPAQMAQEEPPPGDEERRKLRIQGILDERLKLVLLDVTEINIPSAHATYLKGIARWLRQKVTDLVLHDWRQLVSWSQGDQGAETQKKIARWLARELLPERKPGLQELTVLAHTILTQLEAAAPDGPTPAQVEKCTDEVVSRQLPRGWFGFVDAVSEQVAVYQQPAQADTWTDRLVDNTRLEMIAQAMLRMGGREDLLRKSARVLSANLAWFSDLYRQMNQQWEWHQKARDAHVEEKEKLEKSGAPPRPDDVEAKIAEAVRAIAEAEEELARIKPAASRAIEQLLSAQLLPCWQHDLQGLSQAVLQVLPELAGEQPPSTQPGERQSSSRRGSSRRKKPELLPPEERQLLVRPLLERELPAGWQGMLDKVTSAVEENLPRLTELQRERMSGKDVLGSVQDLLREYMDRWQPHNLFHWVYDIPEGGPAAALYIPRVPPFEIKPRVELGEYLGLFLTYLQQRSQGKGRQRSY